MGRGRGGGGILRRKKVDSSVEWEETSRRVAMADVLKVHDYGYIERIAKICKTVTGVEST